MKYTQLRSFHAVASAGSVTAAARKLHVSQPALTTQIRALEEAYAVQLFMRARAGMKLTDAGRRLQAMTRRLFAEEEEVRHFLAESRELRTGRISVGAVSPFHATEMLVAFHERYPQIEIAVSVGNSQDVLESLLEFRSDVAVLGYVEPDPHLYVSQYSKDAIVAFGRHDHPLFKRKRKGLRIAELDAQPMVAREHGSNTRRASEEAMRRAGVRPRVLMEIGSREAVREAVASGVGFGMVSSAEYIPDDRTTFLPIIDADIFNFAHLVCLRSRVESRLVAAFLTVAEELKRHKNDASPSDRARSG